MAIQLLLDRAQPVCIQLKIAPSVAVLTSLHFMNKSGIRLQAPSSRAPRAHMALPGPPTGAMRCAHRRRAATRPVATCTTTSSGPCDDATWRQLIAVFEADLRYRMQHLAEGGILRLFGGLFPGARFDGELLHMATPCSTTSRTCMNTLVLMPAMLRNRMVALLTPEAHTPAVLLYPAWRPTWREEAMLSAPALRALAHNVRFGLLADLHQPRTADELAHRHGMEVGNVGRHLAELVNAGLLSACTDGYTLTELASTLTGPPCDTCAEAEIGYHLSREKRHRI